MNASKTGLLSLLIGAMLLFGTWLFAFQEAGITAMLVSTLTGATILLGLFFLLLGLLMLAV